MSSIADTVNKEDSTVRVFVGNLQNNLDASLEDLYKRFGTFGQCVDPVFEKHNGFAYINMTFEDGLAGFKKLKNSLNNVKFKGNLLVIDQAKPDWQESWKLRQESDERDNVIKEKKNMKKNWEHYKKLENIAMSWKDHREVIPGRVRKTPRSKYGMRHITFRINVEGSLKVYKCYQTKLWGYERNKDLRDLVSKFINGKWRNGFDHIVDRLDYSRAKRSAGAVHFRNKNGDTLSVSVNNNTTNKTDHNTGSTTIMGDEDYYDDDEHLSEEEKTKNNEVLSKVLQGFDFDKPMLVDDEDDEGSADVVMSDYELEAKFKDLDNEAPKKEVHKPVSNVVKFDDDVAEEKGEEEHVEEEEEEEDEPIPTFGASVVEGTVSNTDTLRTLFNPEQVENPASFKLIEDSDEDIAHDANNEKSSNEIPTTLLASLPKYEPLPATKKSQERTNHLFFPHFESPFLVGQTQLNKLVTNSVKKDEILTAWEDQFWENRGTWMREMKNKKRDALRQLRKRKGKNGGEMALI